MRTGKTTVGKEDARYLGRKFIDTDSAICEESNCENVQDFFSKFGESLFRKKESEIISKLADSGNVISLGGGSDQNSEIKDIYGFHYEDFKLENYDPHPSIKAPIAV